MTPSVLAFTPGEPAGIGPDLAVLMAQSAHPYAIVAIADPDLLEARARLLGLDLKITAFTGKASAAGKLQVIPVTAGISPRPGMLDSANVDYVLETLQTAVSGCLDSRFDAMVTGPIQKSIISDTGMAFTGHTEFLAQQCGVSTPVMMLANDKLKVALVTTHLPLAQVSGQITETNVEQVIRVVAAYLARHFGLSRPRLAVCGLNPHAGENGHLGTEDSEVIEPVIRRLEKEGFNLAGPLPADTAFTPGVLASSDAVIAMYHDQGLPVVKALGFGETVNITLGLPIIRTSVDHGTALPLAGSGRINTGSLTAALDMADSMVRHGHGG